MTSPVVIDASSREHLSIKEAHTPIRWEMRTVSEQRFYRISTMVRALDQGYWLSYCSNLPGLRAQANSAAAANDALREVVAAAVEYWKSEGEVVPFGEVDLELGDTIGPQIIIEF